MRNRALVIYAGYSLCDVNREVVDACEESIESMFYTYLEDAKSEYENGTYQKYAVKITVERVAK